MLILLDEPNVLILDEPGNDLDTDMLAAVEDLLDGWPGTLLLVTHDRYLMERVTDDQFALIDGKIRHLPGGIDEFLRLTGGRDRDEAVQGATWDDWRAQGGAAHVAAAAAQEPAAAQSTSTDEAARLSGGEQRALRKLMASNEKKIATLKGKIEAKRAEMGAVDPSDYLALTAIQDEIAAFQESIDELELEWLEAAETLGE